jgi:hypothetical protein
MNILRLLDLNYIKFKNPIRLNVNDLTLVIIRYPINIKDMLVESII